MTVFPLIMRALEPEREKYWGETINFPQFRALFFLRDNERVNLSLLADFLGMTVSSTSKLVDALMQRGWLTSETPSTDRRFKLLLLTASGEEEIRKFRESILTSLSERMQAISDHECQIVLLAMNILGSVFAKPHVLNQKIAEFIRERRENSAEGQAGGGVEAAGGNVEAGAEAPASSRLLD